MTTIHSSALAPDLGSPELEVRDYLASVIEVTGPVLGPPSEQKRDPLAEAAFDLLTSRDFCYLSRTKTAPYRDEVLELIRRRTAEGEALRIFFDIGPGYHATTRPGLKPLNFNTGLSELLILYQISSFSKRLAEFYPPAAHFWLVVDNICGLRTNDIALELSEGYCMRLRGLG